MFKVMALVVVCIIMVSCKGRHDNSQIVLEERLSGPCVHEYRDALISIVSAKEIHTGYKLSQVYISNIIFNGHAQNLIPTSENLLNFSVDANGGGYCTVPCSFLEGEGKVSFVVSANGYMTKAIELNARYENFNGGCPSSSEGSVKLNIELDPEN